MASDKSASDWFASWFDSPFYHKLYANRDQEEADRFIRALVRRLNLQPGDPVLDLACGAGRHARVMHAMKLDVSAIDLSPNSIHKARQISDAKIRFEVADMRSFDLNTSFQAIFNLFTSFGYFEQRRDNEKVLSTVVKHLNKGGTFVIDYLNATKVMRDLVPEEQIQRDGVTFDIRRECADGFVLKHITFDDPKGTRQFTERVQLFNLAELEEMLEAAGLQVVDTFGSYELTPFNEQESPRLILITRLQ